MDKETSVILRNKKDSKRIRQCRVVFSYKQDHEDELNLNVGDIIDILGEEEEGWWRGRLNGMTGVFPSNFVEEINTDKLKSGREDLSISNDGDSNIPLPPKPAKILCEVKYSYKAQNEDELNLKEGDIVTLLSKDGQDPGWWKGELNGLIGVFPDNFVVILPYNADKNSNEKSPTITQNPVPNKPSSIASQRKSLENKNQNHSEKLDNLGHGDNKTTPPVPSKKPAIAVKKSPPGSSATGSLFSGIKKKIVDVVDGATSSKSSSPSSKTEHADNSSENVFDQVERLSLLTDVRATRPKAPAGRRPPSVVFREEETTIPNGIVEPLNLDVVSEQSGSSDTDTSEVKPKLREWEKHKAPWLAEMKLSQAKRTSPSPGPPETKLKLTPTEKNDPEETKPEPRTSKPETEMSKSLTSLSSTPLSSKVKGENEKVPLRPKPNLTNIPTPRPASIQSVSPIIPPTDITQKPPTPAHPKISPMTRTPSPLLHKIEKNSSNEVRNVDNDVTISFKQYTELVERIHKLELLVEKQNVIHTAAIDELKGKLQLETEMRHMLQVQLEKVASQNLMQEQDSSSSEDFMNEDVRLRPADVLEEHTRYTILFLITTVIGIASIALIYYWISTYNNGFSLESIYTEFNWHIFLMILGFVFLYAQSLLLNQSFKHLPRLCRVENPFSKQRMYWIVVGIKIMVFVLAVLGLQAAFDLNNFQQPPQPNLYTLHAWLGIGAVILLSINIILDFMSYAFKKISDNSIVGISSMSSISSIMAFITGICASGTGLLEEAIFVFGSGYKKLPVEAVLLNVIGVMIMVFGILVLNLLQKRKKTIRMNS